MKAAFGTAFKWNGIAIATLSTINGVELTAETFDVSNHQSPDGYTESVPGMKTAGDITLEGFAKAEDTDGQVAMINDFNNSAKREWSIVFPGSYASWSGYGHITAIKFGDAPVNGAIPFTATIKPTGKPTLSISESTGLTTPFFAMSGGGTLTPAAANDVYEYVYNVANVISSITLTPTAAGQTIKVNGNTVESGQASSAISLTAGEIVDIKVEVTEPGKVPVTYVIHAIEAAAA